MADEIQSGLGRTGKLFASMHEGVTPDVMIIGKALSGGFYPVSAVLSSREVLGVFRPGDHGSTFGGSPLACAIARAALRVIVDEKLPARSAELGAYALNYLKNIHSPYVVEADLDWGLEQIRAVLEDGTDARSEAVAELAGTTVAGN